MSRFIVAGKGIKGTPPPTLTDFGDYTELGWEVTTSFLEAYYGRKTGVFREDDILVTATGREDLYRPFFSQVIDFSTYLLEKNRLPTIDLVRPTQEFYKTDRPLTGHYPLDKNLHRWRIHWRHFWRYRHQYKPIFNRADLIPKIPLPAPDSPYLCICVRILEHEPQRNLPDRFWLDLFDALRDRLCYVVGLGVEHLLRHPLHRLCPLAEYLVRVASPQCEAVIGTMTGTLQLAQLLHPNRLIVLDLDNHYVRWSRSLPCVLADFTNFSGVPHHLYNYVPTVTELVEDVRGQAGPSRFKPESLAKSRYLKIRQIDQARHHAFYEVPKAPIS